MASQSHSLYDHLGPGTIRVLELCYGSFDAPLTCKIVTQLISDKAYEALSYVWGDPTPVTSITVLGLNGAKEGELGVGRGLSDALFAFRHTHQTRRMWIDALCINQKDVDERQSQVRMMGAVYSKAEQVLCWLGLFDAHDEGIVPKAHLAIDFLRQFNNQPHEYLYAARQLFHSAGLDLKDTNTELLNAWLAIKELFDIEYFHRAWIIQEVGLARHARFFWGSQNMWLDWTEIATFCSFMDANGASIINHLQLKSWVANHINFVWATDSSGKPVHNFVEVLHWARVHKSTDPRDFVYALLSHTSAKIDDRLLVQPDYTITTAQAYVGLALNVIERTNSLQILAFVDHHEDPSVLNLPTWVPDWHALNLVAPLRCPTQAAAETDNSILITELNDGMALHCRGMFIDTIRTTSNMIVPSELTITTTEVETQKKTPFLIDHIWDKTVVDPRLPLASSGEFVASLSLVLTGGYLNDTHSTSGVIQEQQQADFAALVLEYERIRMSEYCGGFFASLPPKEKALIETMAAKGSAHQFVQDMTWTSMCRRVFRTDKGHIGLGPRIMNESDICVVLSGAVFPMVLRKCGSHFRLVGPALLYGFMNREAEDLCRNGTLLEQRLKII